MHAQREKNRDIFVGHAALVQHFHDDRQKNIRVRDACRIVDDDRDFIAGVNQFRQRGGVDRMQQRFTNRADRIGERLHLRHG